MTVPIISDSVKFPARVTATAPMLLDIAGANYNFSIDVDALTLSITELDGEVSIMSFPGVDPTGVLDSSAARDAAQAAVGSWGNVIIPAGTYRFDTPPAGSALWKLRHGVTLIGTYQTLPGVVMSTPNGRDQWSGALTGAQSSEYYHNADIFTSDSLTNTANTYCRMVKLTGRDSTSTGGRFALAGLAQMDTPGSSTQTAGKAFYCGLFGQAIANYDHAATGHSYLPAVFAANSNVVATANCAGWGNIICHEFDVTTYIGADYTSRVGGAFVLNGDGPKATTRDAGIAFLATAGTTGWDYLISIDKLSGGQPIATDGTILGVPSGAAMTIANGIKFDYGLVFTGHPFISPGWSVDGSGNESANSLATQTDLAFNNASAPADQHLSRWSTDANGQPRLQALTDALAASSWVTFTRTGGTPAAAVFATKVFTPASATIAGFNMSPGSAPSSAADGDMWATTTSVFARINGATKTLAALETAQTWTKLQTFNGGVAVNGGTLVADTPVVLTQTWNNAGVVFYGLRVDITDTASVSSSLLLYATVDGVAKFSVRKDGLLIAPSIQGTTYILSPIVYGGFAASSVLSLYSTGGAGTTDKVRVLTGSQVERWYWPTAGHFTPFAAATYDIGNSTNTVRALYLSDGVYNGANKIIGARKTGWGAPSGTLDRTSLAAYAGQTVSAGYVQAEAQATDNAIKKLSQVVAALINDLHASGTGSPTHMLLAA